MGFGKAIQRSKVSLGDLKARGCPLSHLESMPSSAALYFICLKGLTSYTDKINKSDLLINASVKSKMHSLVADLPKTDAYTDSDMTKVINQQAGLLTSYAVLQAERTELLKAIVAKMKENPEAMILRHGGMLKTNADAVDILQGKNMIHVESVSSNDPVVNRKLEIKLDGIAATTKFANHHYLKGVIHDIKGHLTAKLLQPRVIKLCRCMKSVYVQCEMRCDDMLRRVAWPRCNCGRKIDEDEIRSLAPGATLHKVLDRSYTAPGYHIKLTQCPPASKRDGETTCPGRSVCGPCVKSNMVYYFQYTSGECETAASVPSPHTRRDAGVRSDAKGTQVHTSSERLTVSSSSNGEHSSPTTPHSSSPIPMSSSPIRNSLSSLPPTGGSQSINNVHHHQHNSEAKDHQGPTNLIPERLCTCNNLFYMYTTPEDAAVLTTSSAQSQHNFGCSALSSEEYQAHTSCYQHSPTNNPAYESYQSMPPPNPTLAPCYVTVPVFNADNSTTTPTVNQNEGSPHRTASPYANMNQNMYYIISTPASFFRAYESAHLLSPPAHAPPVHLDANPPLIATPIILPMTHQPGNFMPPAPYPSSNACMKNISTSTESIAVSTSPTPHYDSTSSSWESAATSPQSVSSGSPTTTPSLPLAPPAPPAPSAPPAPCAPIAHLVPPVPHMPLPTLNPPRQPAERPYADNDTALPTDTRVRTYQMYDFQSMLVSLMWNVQACRDWLQAAMQRALSQSEEVDSDQSEDDAFAQWIEFKNTITSEAIQWRHYNLFNRQLAKGLTMKYLNKKLTCEYEECQRGIVEIIEIFSKWTQWLIAVLKETQTLSPKPGKPMHKICWAHFEKKVQANLDDWNKYDAYLKMCLEQKYSRIMSICSADGPVWVVSASGAVPSGAVSAGMARREPIWVARTIYKAFVLPAALIPSMHCCLVHTNDGTIYRSKNYQVMCNANAEWVPWNCHGPRDSRSGSGGGCDVGARAVLVAPGVHVGRILYRDAHIVGAVLTPHNYCHVVISGRPFAFDKYELLVLCTDSCSSFFTSACFN